MPEEILPEDLAREVADLLGTSVRVVQMMSEDEVIRELVGSDLSLPALTCEGRDAQASRPLLLLRRGRLFTYATAQHWRKA